MVSFTHEQNIICSQTQLDNIAHKQTIICRQLFAGHVLTIEKEEKLFATNNNVLLLKLTKIQYKKNTFISNSNVA